MSDFWIRKIRTYFRIIDLDSDGVVSREEFVNIAERLCDVEKADPVQKETARQLVSDVFSHYIKAAGTDGDVLLTEDLLIASLKMQRDDPAFEKAVGDAVLSVFAVMNVKRDGYLEFQEIPKLFRNAGLVVPKFTKQAFEAIDVNHDGKVSLEEFINSANDYLCSDDENTEALFGLLV